MSTRTTLRRTAGALFIAGLSTLAPAAPAAHADSIAYIKGGDVYLATPDGSRSFRVTATGGYESVSQDDAGRMVAVHGNRIAYLSREGQVLADILTPVSNPARNQTFTGPFDAQLSPNGQKVSYSYYWEYQYEDATCQRAYGCYVGRLYHGTGYTRPDSLTAWDEPGFRRQTGWIHGSWIDDETQLLSDPSMKPNEDLVLTSPGEADGKIGFKRWAEHRQAKQLEDGEMTRDRTKMAFITGEKNDHVWFYNLRTGFYPKYPSTCNTYELNNPAGGRFHDLTWSPDGSHLAYADGEGIATIAIPAFGTAESDCGTPTEDTKLVIPGATSPDWGPANVPPAPVPTPAPTPGGGNGGGGGITTPGGIGKGNGTGTKDGSGKDSGSKGSEGGSGGSSQNGGGSGGSTTGSAVRLAGSDRIGKALKTGLKLKVDGAASGLVGVTAKVGGKTIGRGQVTVGKDGTASFTLKLSKAARAKLKGKSVTLQIVAGNVSGSITLRR